MRALAAMTPISPAVTIALFGVLLAAWTLGAHASFALLVFLGAGLAALALIQRPILGLPLLVAAALLFPLEIGTGSEVRLNGATLLLIVLLALWALMMAARRRVRVLPSRVNMPLLLFVAGGLVSLAVGRLLWDPAVPIKSSLWLVQMGQWAIFALSAGAFWLMGNQIASESWLRRMTATFLIIAGGVAILRMIPGAGMLVGSVTTMAFIRAPLWVLLAALAGGQLLFNATLTRPQRIFLAACVLATLVYSFRDQQEATSNWVAVGVVMGILVWFRWPRLRGMMVAGIIVLALAGLLGSALYNFAGGDDEWNRSGGSRMTLITRVVEVSMRNPVTGLGPAAYRVYAGMKPLLYGRAYWIAPAINSHNNYVDLFSQLGVVGLALFFWFAWEVTRLGMRLRRIHQSGFLAGYVNGMLAAGAAALVLMLFADWILPFVYNIGFPGFQASVLVWLFLGGLVAIEHLPATLRGEPGKDQPYG